jgi:hypothetical protein
MREAALAYARSCGWLPPEEFVPSLIRASEHPASYPRLDAAWQSMVLDRDNARRRVRELTGALRDLLRDLPQREGASGWHAAAAHAREVLG